MIEARQELLNVEAQDALHRWLDKGEFSTLVKVAQAQAKLHEVKALAEAAEVAKGFPLKIESANASLADAARYATFLDVLKEIKEQKTPYITVKLS